LNATFINAIATYGASLITHIGLANSEGVELSGGDPAYARKPVTWLGVVDGIVRIAGDYYFDIPAGADVQMWKGYSALTGGIDYGGALVERVTTSQQHTYILYGGAERNTGIRVY